MGVVGALLRIIPCSRKSAPGFTVATTRMQREIWRLDRSSIGLMDTLADPRHQEMGLTEAWYGKLLPNAALDRARLLQTSHYDNHINARRPICFSEIKNAEHMFLHCLRSDNEREELCRTYLNKQIKPEDPGK
ncbi:unnamed protein product [Trichogramma brassicae]|uniref:Uncharacterized protein n=1 Tax=Trichogramma brassicae TaxID=86971 RepID=A0A6H5IAV6_9HYME|nr:unnamed protein product [Trichogramma brassicae]